MITYNYNINSVLANISLILNSCPMYIIKNDEAFLLIFSDKDTDRDVSRIIKKVNRLQTKFNLLLFTGFLTPFWLIVLLRYGPKLGGWMWLVTLAVYCPILLYLFQR